MFKHSVFSFAKIVFTCLITIAFYSSCFALSGSGTETDPYTIQSFEDFQEFTNNSAYWATGMYTRLDIDINLDPSLPGREIYVTAVISPDISSVGDEFDGVSYSGNFDGNNHFIIHLTINAPDAPVDFLGLFGHCDGATIKNVKMFNGYISGGQSPCYNDEEYSHFFGGLVGYNNAGTIVNCYSNVNIPSYGGYVGGIVGFNSGIVSNCYSTNGIIKSGTPTCSSPLGFGGIAGGNSGDIGDCYSSVNMTNISSSSGTGGLVGLNYGNINNCFTTADVRGSYDVGGLVGRSSGDIRQCYTLGNVTATSGGAGGLAGDNWQGYIADCYAMGNVVATNSQAGGFVGDNYRGSVVRCCSIGTVSGEYPGGFTGGLSHRVGYVSNSFWDIQTSGMTTSPGGTGKTTSQMKTQSTFTNAGWDFVNYWDIEESNTYPYLRDIPQFQAWYPEAKLTNTLKGEMVSSWDHNADHADFDDSVYEGGVVLASWTSDSKPTYRFIMPNPQFLPGFRELDEIKITIYGEGGNLIGQSAGVIIGGQVMDDLGTSERKNEYTFNGEIARSLLQASEDDGVTWYLDVTIDARGNWDWYDVNDVTLEYMYIGVETELLARLDQVLNGREMINSFAEYHDDYLVQGGLVLDRCGKGIQAELARQCVSLAASVLPGEWGQAIEEFRSSAIYEKYVAPHEPSILAYNGLLDSLATVDWWIWLKTHSAVNTDFPYDLQQATDALLYLAQVYSNAASSGQMVGYESLINANIIGAVEEINDIVNGEFGSGTVLSAMRESYNVHTPEQYKPAAKKAADGYVAALAPLVKWNYDIDAGQQTRDDPNSYLWQYANVLEKQILNDPPTDITLSSNLIHENQSVNSVVGVLNTIDPLVGAPFTYSLVGGDIELFIIDNDTLLTNAVFTEQSPRAYSITVRSEDNLGLYFEKDLVIKIPLFFADPNLKDAVESSLGIENPTEDEMLGLYLLFADNKSITDLTGLEYATNLFYLFLDNNHLTNLPPEIGNLTNLVYLILNNNQLTSLPPEVGNLTNIAYLILNNNQLDILPPEVGNLINLTYLYLHENQLTSLPAEFGNFTSLTDLTLNGNQLNTGFYCSILPVINDNNPGAYITYDPNPNPLSNDCSTDMLDFAIFALHWMENNCDEGNNWCGGADLNHIDDVDGYDLAVFCEYWLNTSP